MDLETLEIHWDQDIIKQNIKMKEEIQIARMEKNIYKYSNEWLTEEAEKPNTKEESTKKLNSSKFIKQLPINYKSPNTLMMIG